MAPLRLLNVQGGGPVLAPAHLQASPLAASPTPGLPAKPLHICPLKSLILTCWTAPPAGGTTFPEGPKSSPLFPTLPIHAPCIALSGLPAPHPVVQASPGKPEGLSSCPPYTWLTRSSDSGSEVRAAAEFVTSVSFLFAFHFLLFPISFLSPPPELPLTVLVFHSEPPVGFFRMKSNLLATPSVLLSGFQITSSLS